MNLHAAPTTARSLRVEAKAESIDQVAPATVEMPMPQPGPGQVLVEVVASAVNPSDVKAALGFMPHAIWPRVPGRDYAGIVRKGPDALVGREVWGGGGDLGISRDGTHGSHVVLPVSAIREKPASLSFEEAGGIGVPFITAYEGLREAGGLQPFDTILVCGVNGKVAQAVIQIATMMRARVFAVSYKPATYVGHANEAIEVFDTSSQDVEAELRERTGGRGVDVVFNTVGSPYFALANRVMAKLGRQIFISTFDRAVDFDIFTFFRGRHRFVGFDSLALDASYCAGIFDRLGPKFDQGLLKPFPVEAEAVFGLDKAKEAYARVFGGAVERIILRP